MDSELSALTADAARELGVVGAQVAVVHRTVAMYGLRQRDVSAG